ncbi:MAG: DNA-methyltransferase [Bacillota bacterium]
MTDPPYGIALQLKCNRIRPATIIGDGRQEAPKLWRSFLPELARVAKDNTAHLVFGTWKSIWMKDLLSEHFTVKGCIVWDKRCIGLGYYLRPRWELIWYCVKGNPPKPRKAPADIWECLRELRPLHPCQKPVALLRRCIQFVSRPGDLVCDPFAGTPPRRSPPSKKAGDFLAMRSIPASTASAKTAYLTLFQYEIPHNASSRARDSRAMWDSSHPLQTPIEPL